MTISPSSNVSPHREALLANARALAPLLDGSAEEIDAARRLPGHIVAAMKAAGLFRMSMPAAWGGFEADPITQNLVIEEVAAANGSAGWCLLIGLSGGYLSAMLDDEIGRRMYTDPDMISANAFVPPGAGIEVAGGIRVTGRWPFASGITHAHWVQAPVLVQDDAGNAVNEVNGQPMRRIVFVPVEDVEIIDTWQTTGLKGTGSCDFAMHDLFVPLERCANMAAPWKRPGPLYGSFLTGLMNHFGVPLGIARRANADFITLVRVKPAKHGIEPPSEASTQIALAEATATIRAARAYAFSTLETAWANLADGSGLTVEDRIAWRLANAHVHDSCAHAVDLLHHAAGSVSVYLPNPIDRCWRDIHTARQHGIVAGRVYEKSGHGLLTGDLPPGW